MHYLIIDTCVWLNLCSTNPVLIDVISELIDANAIRIILPKIIRDEWQKHKDNKLIKNKIQSANGKVKNALQISEYLEKAEKDVFIDILKKFQMDNEKVKEMALSAIRKTEIIFNHHTTINLELNDKHKLKAIEFGLYKKAPFKEKNSTADFLILYSTYDYIQLNKTIPAFFITDNINDFSSNENKNLVHPDLSEFFDDSTFIYSTNVGKAINLIKADSINQRVIDDIEEHQKNPLCPQCNRAMMGPFYTGANEEHKRTFICFQCDLIIS